MRIALLPAAALLVVLAIGLVSELTRDQPGELDSRARLVEIARFEQPTYVTSPPGDRRLFVVERTGRIWILVNGERLVRPFVDLSDIVTTESIEDGLLSVAFPPDFATSRRLYVDFTARGGGDSVVLELHVSPDDPDVADRHSSRTVLRLRNAGVFHHGGLVAFGPDGLLYVGQGDGLFPYQLHVSQRLDSLHGKILRIDPRPRGKAPYTVPPTNPLVGRSGRGEIYALGLRNPWRFTWGPDGALYVADVGGVRVEEINRVPLTPRVAANFGWPCREGTETYRPVPYIEPYPPDVCPGAVAPIFQTVREPHLAFEEPLEHAAPAREPRVVRAGRDARTHFLPGSAECAVIGGVFVRDPRLGALRGRYLFGDFCDPTIRSLRIDDGQVVDAAALDIAVPGLTSFGEDNSGRIYLTSLDGHVYRLDPSSR